MPLSKPALQCGAGPVEGNGSIVEANLFRFLSLAILLSLRPAAGYGDTAGAGSVAKYMVGLVERRSA